MTLRFPEIIRWNDPIPDNERVQFKTSVASLPPATLQARYVVNRHIYLAGVGFIEVCT